MRMAIYLHEWVKSCSGAIISTYFSFLDGVKIFLIPIYKHRKLVRKNNASILQFFSYIFPSRKIQLS